MQFTTIFAAALSACLVAAVPTESYLPEMGDGSGENMCGNQQKAACCNGDNQAGGQAGLIGGLLGGLLGGDCTLSVRKSTLIELVHLRTNRTNISLVGGVCSQGSVACCPTTNVNSQVRHRSHDFATQVLIPPQSLVSLGSVCVPISL